MINYGGRFEETLDVYHGIPKGWTKEEVIAMHQSLSGTFGLNSSMQIEPGAPSWLPDRKNWLQYRKTLYLLSDGVAAGDSACVELCIQYLEYAILVHIQVLSVRDLLESSSLQSLLSYK